MRGRFKHILLDLNVELGVLIFRDFFFSIQQTAPMCSESTTAPKQCMSLFGFVTAWKDLIFGSEISYL